MDLHLDTPLVVFVDNHITYQALQVNYVFKISVDPSESDPIASQEKPIYNSHSLKMPLPEGHQGFMPKKDNPPPAFLAAERFFSEHPERNKWHRREGAIDGSFIRAPDGTIWQITPKKSAHSGAFGRVKSCVNAEGQKAVIKTQALSFSDLTQPIQSYTATHDQFILNEGAIAVDQGLALSPIFGRNFSPLSPPVTSLSFSSYHASKTYAFLYRACHNNTELHHIMNQITDNYNADRAEVFLVRIKEIPTQNDILLYIDKDFFTGKYNTLAQAQWNPATDPDFHFPDEDSLHILSETELASLAPYFAPSLSHVKICQLQHLHDKTLADHLNTLKQLPSSPDKNNHRLDLAIQLLIQGYRLHAGLSSKTQRPTVHRDLKPTNVMLDAKGRLVFVDFGLASFEPHQLLAQSFCGTRRYLPVDDSSCYQWSWQEADCLAIYRIISYPQRGLITYGNPPPSILEFSLLPPLLRDLLDTSRLTLFRFRHAGWTLLSLAAALIAYRDNPAITQMELESLRSCLSDQTTLVEQYQHDFTQAIQTLEQFTDRLILYESHLKSVLAKTQKQDEQDLVQKKVDLLKHFQTIVTDHYLSPRDKCKKLEAHLLLPLTVHSLSQHRSAGFFAIGKSEGQKFIDAALKLFQQEGATPENTPAAPCI